MKDKPMSADDNFSYVETPREAAARYLDRAVSEICKALALHCMEDEVELRMELFHIGEELCQKRIDIGGIPKKPFGIPFKKLEAK